MDLFTLLILVLFFLLPAISRLFQKKTEPPPATPDEAPQHYGQADEGREPYRQQPRPMAESDDSLAEALRQIREALGEPSPQAGRRPEPPTPPRPEPARRTPAPPLPARSAPPVRPQPARPEAIRRGPTRFEKPVLPDVDLDAPVAVEIVSGPAGRYSWLVNTLRDPEGARKAIKLHEVIDPPPGLKNLGFRRR